jgi:hypothetical protein
MPFKWLLRHRKTLGDTCRSARQCVMATKIAMPIGAGERKRPHHPWRPDSQTPPQLTTARRDDIPDLGGYKPCCCTSSTHTDAAAPNRNVTGRGGDGRALRQSRAEHAQAHPTTTLARHQVHHQCEREIPGFLTLTGGRQKDSTDMYSDRHKHRLLVLQEPSILAHSPGRTRLFGEGNAFACQARARQQAIP